MPASGRRPGPRRGGNRKRAGPFGVRRLAPEILQGPGEQGLLPGHRFRGGGRIRGHPDRRPEKLRPVLPGRKPRRPLTGDIYRLDLAFSKKFEQDIIDFSPTHYFVENRTYYFWYNNGDRIVFKVGTTPVAIPILHKEVTRVDIQSMDTYSVDRQKLFKDLSFGDASTAVTLQIRFN
jgi:hypothetical protein